MHCYDALFSFLRSTTGPSRIETGLGGNWVERHSISVRRFNMARGINWCLSASLFLSVGSEAEDWLVQRCREYRRRVCRFNLFLSLSFSADVRNCVTGCLGFCEHVRYL
jgi:hypothetical protein